MLILSINWPTVIYLIFISTLILIVVAIVISKNIEEKRELKALEKAKEEAEAEKAKSDSRITISAIAMALYLYYSDVYHEKDDLITIKKINNRYSPWNSKIYGIQ